MAYTVCASMSSAQFVAFFIGKDTEMGSSLRDVFLPQITLISQIHHA